MMPGGMKFLGHSAKVDHVVASRHEKYNFDYPCAGWITIWLYAGKFAS